MSEEEQASLKLKSRFNGLKNQIVNDVPKLMQQTGKGKRGQPTPEIDFEKERQEELKRKEIVETKYTDKVRSKNAFFLYEKNQP